MAWTRRRKFFHESHGKYDARYYRAALPLPEAIGRLTEALDVFMQMSRDAGAAPFIGHGTLIGWWWSRRVLPWDDDIDLLVTFDGLVRLRPWHSRVLGGHYLFEINPNHVDRRTRNRSFVENREPNRIDARLIDERTGLYLDITALHSLGDGRLATKCPHVLPADWLFPLLPATLEGVAVFVPRRAEEVLSDEYGPDVLTCTRFNGYVFDGEAMIWRKQD